MQIEFFTEVEKCTNYKEKKLVLTPIALYTKNRMEEFGYSWSSNKIHNDWFGCEFSMSKKGREFKITMRKALDEKTEESKIFLEYKLDGDFQEASFIYYPLKFESVEALSDFLAQKLDEYINTQANVYKPLWVEMPETGEQ